MGMEISASGVLLRAAQAVKSGGSEHLKFPLRQLYDHLKEVKQRHEAGDSKAVLDEFFGIWTQFEAPSGLGE